MQPIAITSCQVDDLCALEVEWRELETRADPSFFQSWSWIGCWLAQTRLRPILLKASIEGQTVGLGIVHASWSWRNGWLPVKSLLLHESGDPRIDALYIEYNGFLVDRRWERPVIESVLRHLMLQKRLDGVGAWDELRLSGVPPAYAAYAASASGIDLVVRLIDEQPASAIDLRALQDSGRTHLSCLSANTRYQIRRSLQHYARRGALSVTPAHDLAQALEFLDRLKSLHQATWVRRGKPGAFSNPFFERFHRDLIRRCHPQGGVELLRVSAGESEIGYLYNFIHRGWVGNYASGFVFEQDGKLKPGLVCLVSAARHHAQQGACVFDLMAGESRYKASLATSQTSLQWISLQRPRLKFVLADIVKRGRDTLLAYRGNRASPVER
ncbi:GNAT family N-acetyltransferase [Lacisediminimonas profundi]|uniref:GNAT family N-acetyltransferase n=1 Tax=Lacisediminimonas profundi TaxID=2603856 RepID=UPI00124B46CC|nr:GNAT family N-acetyltransferase [Lacisediminimonas profundi]